MPQNVVRMQGDKRLVVGICIKEQSSTQMADKSVESEEQREELPMNLAIKATGGESGNNDIAVTRKRGSDSMSLNGNGLKDEPRAWSILKKPFQAKLKPISIPNVGDRSLELVEAKPLDFLIHMACSIKKHELIVAGPEPEVISRLLMGKVDSTVQAHKAENAIKLSAGASQPLPNSVHPPYRER